MINMGNDIITCFNQQECTYKECPMYSEKLDLCKIELLKSEPNPVDNPRTEKKTPVGEQTTRKPEEGKSPLESIEAGKFVKSVTGTVTTKPETREVNTGEGPKEIAEFNISDGVATAKLTVWEPDLEVKNLLIGTKIRVEALGSKDYKGELQLSTTRKSTISYL